MKLPTGHPLAQLAEDENYRIKEAAQGFLCTVALLAADGKSLETTDSPAGFLHLRQAIPFTRGRATPGLIEQHVKSAVSRNWPTVRRGEFVGQSLAICGGGPSLGHTLYELRHLQRHGTKVLAINRTHDYLVNLPKSHGLPWIKPWAGILLESIPHAANYISPIGGVRYYIGSQCHPSTFDRFEKFDHRVWHCECSVDITSLIPAEHHDTIVPANSSTCGMRSILKSWMEGFGIPTRQNPDAALHLFGFDSCYNSEDVHNGIRGSDSHPRLHAYHKPEAIHDVKHMVVKGWDDGKDRSYWGNTNMLSQADEFRRFIEQRKDAIKRGTMPDWPLVVHGFGIIPDIAREEGMHFDQWTYNPFRKTQRRAYG
jgi:hypothetical protein